MARTRRASAFGRLLKFGTAGLAITGGLAIYGFNRTFARSGESALSYISSDAYLVVVWDFQPSPSQLMLFRNIYNSAQAEGADQFLGGMTGDPKVGKAIAAGGTRSGLMAMASEKPEDVIALIRVTDEGAFTRELGSSLSESPTRLGQSKMFGALKNGYLVAGATEKSVSEQVARMTSPPAVSFASSAEFQSARNDLDKNSHLMFFMNAEKLKANAAKWGAKPDQMKGFDKYRGMVSFGMTVSDQGMTIQGGAVDMIGLGSVPSISGGLPNSIPGNPLGFYGMQTLKPYLTEIQKEKEVMRTADEALEEFGDYRAQDLMDVFDAPTFIAAYDTATEPAFVMRVGQKDQAKLQKAVNLMRTAIQKNAHDEEVTWSVMRQGDVQHGVFEQKGRPMFGYRMDAEGLLVSNNVDLIRTGKMNVATPASLLNNWQAQAAPNTKGVFALDPKAVKGLVVKMMGSSPEVEKWTGLFDTGLPLVLSWGQSGDRTTFKGIIPLNWDKLGDAIKTVSKPSQTARLN